MDSTLKTLSMKLKNVHRLYKDVQYYDKEISDYKTDIEKLRNTPDEEVEDKAYYIRKKQELLTETIGARSSAYLSLRKHVGLAGDAIKAAGDTDYSSLQKEIETLRIAEKFLAVS
ncbi:hypothetical protein GJ496_002687 [Pomphorhynchus laevis]|nr:hypothetical protein GJ496_002687 [Pomphorhynchus laevis]